MQRNEQVFCRRKHQNKKIKRENIKNENIKREKHRRETFYQKFFLYVLIYSICFQRVYHFL